MKTFEKQKAKKHALLKNNCSTNLKATACMLCFGYPCFPFFYVKRELYRKYHFLVRYGSHFFNKNVKLIRHIRLLDICDAKSKFWRIKFNAKNQISLNLVLSFLKI